MDDYSDFSVRITPRGLLLHHDSCNQGRILLGEGEWDIDANRAVDSVPLEIFLITAEEHRCGTNAGGFSSTSSVRS